MKWKKGVLISSATLLVLVGGVHLGTKIGKADNQKNSKVEEKKDIDLLNKVEKGKDFEFTFDYLKEVSDVEFKIDGEKTNNLIFESKGNNFKLIDPKSKEVLSDFEANFKEIYNDSSLEKAKIDFKDENTSFKFNDSLNEDYNGETLKLGHFKKNKNVFDVNTKSNEVNEEILKTFDDKEYTLEFDHAFDLLNDDNLVLNSNNKIFYGGFNDYKGIISVEKLKKSDFNFFDLVLFEMSSFYTSSYLEETEETKESEKEVTESTEDFDFSNVKFDDNFIRISNNKTNFYAADTLMYQVQILKDKIFPQRYHVKNGRDTNLVSAEFIKNPTEHFMNLIKDDGSSIRYDEVVINTDDYDNIRVYKDNIVNEHIIITLKDGELLATVNASLDLKEDIRLKTSKLTFRTKDFKNAIENKDVTQVYNPSATTDSPFIHIEKDPTITNLGMDKYLEGADTFVLFNEDMNDSYSIIMNQINVSDDYINTAIATLIAIDQQFIFKDFEYNK